MNKFFKYFLFSFSIAIIGIAMYSCANIGSITGGDKDSIPPVMVESKPFMPDTNFKGNKVIVTFDEYFELKDINQEFVASPPFIEAPDFRVKKKNLIIKFLEPLKDSVTYTLSFANAIADFNEGNIYKDFRFVFSTYSTVDSFSIAGNLLNASDLKVPLGAYVMAFDTITDSIPCKSLPSYLSKVDSSGNFSIDHIKPGKYKIFALSDLNGNLKTDDFEPRAFLDSLIVPIRTPFTKVDSLKAGTIIHDFKDKSLSDSLLHDTVIVTSSYKTKPSDLQLYLFKEDNLNQKLLDYGRPARNKLFMSFQLPLTSDFAFNLLNPSVAQKSIILEKDFNNDSIICWINDTSVTLKDTIKVQLKYLQKDSLGVFMTTLDTIEFGFREKKTDDAWKRKQDKSKKVEKNYLVMNFLTTENKIDLNKDLIFESPTPLVQVDTSKIKLFEIKDTTTIDTKEQKIVKAYRQRSDLLYFKLKRPIAKKFWMEGINFKAENWYSLTLSDSNRVYSCQITNSEMARMDTLKLKVHYDNHFFMGQTQQITDTLFMPISAQKILSRKRTEAQRIDIAFDRPQNYAVSIIPDDFSAQGNWYNIQKNRNADSISILITDKKIIDKDTLTFSIRCFDFIGLNGDSVFFNETTRQIFREKQQYLVSANRPKNDELSLVYNKGLSQNPQITSLSFTLNNQWSTVNRNQEGDTINYKITDKFVSSMDTLVFIVKYTDIERRGKVIDLSDTVKFITKKKFDFGTKTVVIKDEKKSAAPQTVQIYLPVKYKLNADTINIRQRIISTEWKSNTKYTIRYDSMAFVDFFKLYVKEGVYDFSTRDIDYYGKLILNLKNVGLTEEGLPDSSSTNDSLAIEKPVKQKSFISDEEIRKYLGDGNIIFQLLGDKGVIEREYFIKGDKEITMEYLHPKKYGLKIIFDRNKNGKWDTGNYFEHIQPERVIVSIKQIELKSGFENNLEWNVGQSLRLSFTAD